MTQDTPNLESKCKREEELGCPRRWCQRSTNDTVVDRGDVIGSLVEIDKRIEITLAIGPQNGGPSEKILYREIKHIKFNRT
jgi:hypothetical protein